MSTIGSGSNGIPNLASSVAGTSAQQKAADTNRTNRDGQIQKFQLDRADQLEKTVGDIGESDGTDERDADGRMPWSFKRSGRGGQGNKSTDSPPHAPDPSAERGTQLDLDA